MLARLTDLTTEISDSDRGEMKNAIEKWEVILKESNLDDRKARIDKKVARNICENLAVCNYFMHNFTEAQKCIDRAREIMKDPWQYALEEKIADMKQRFDANRIPYH